ncbi:MAG: hypothetical protein AAGB26_07260 [Planctomycetota bacterium]
MADDHYPSQSDLNTTYSRGPLAAVLWGAFLGCSWTWVIGMVLPALLLRDYGLYGWFVFAVPNVLGAALMGLVLYRPQWSVNIVRKHRLACQNFTAITIAYHLFVVTWLFGKLFGIAAVPMLVIAVGLCATIGMRNRRSAMLFVAAGVAVISWGCLSWATKAPGAWELADWAWPAEGVNRLSRTDLMWFAPCALFGFALCPYLDLTFHRANYSTSPGTGVGAFFFGFGIVFCSMIIFSVCYGAQLLPFIQGKEDAELAGIWLVLLAVHLTLQAGFTITVHVREAMEDRQANIPWLVTLGGVAILMGLLAKLSVLPDHRITAGLTWGEAGYRLFLIFYGTVLPGYVWLVMIPRLRGPLTNVGNEVRNFIYAVVCGLSLALAWVGFTMGESHLIPVLFGVFIAGRIAVELLPRPGNTV